MAANDKRFIRISSKEILLGKEERSKKEPALAALATRQKVA
jgi:hypothetical protein